MAGKQIVWLVALALMGCASLQPEPKVVNVPVTVRATPPVSLVECGKFHPTFRFEESPQKKDYVSLSPESQLALVRWVDEKDTCIEAWNEWAK